MARARIIPFFMILLIAITSPGLATNLPAIQLDSAVHFLTPGGEDVLLHPGAYEVEATDTGLKLLRAGEARTNVILLEATVGDHEKTLKEPVAHVKVDPDNPDLFHMALLLQDGTGLETVGTVSGIRPRGLNLAFVSKSTQQMRRFTQKPLVQQKSSPTLALPPGILVPKPKSGPLAEAPRPPSAQLSCALSHEVIPGSVLRDHGDSKINWPSQIHVAVFQNQLHVVSGKTSRCNRGGFCGATHPGDKFAHFKFNGKRWAEINIEQKASIGVIDNGTSIALAGLGNGLVGVWKDQDKQLWYSWFYEQWSPKVEIPGQKSKSTPALAVKGSRLHMLHQGKNSDDLWYSVFAPGSGWSKNVKIGQKSEGTPGLAWGNDGFLHVMYQRAGVPNGSPFGELRFTTLFHSYLGRDGKSWLPPYKIAQAESQDSPTMITGSTDKRGQALMVHRGKSTKTLWSTLYGKPNPNRSGGLRWYDDHRLPGPTSDGPVGLAWYQGCLHMVHKEGKKLIHTTMSLKHAHPEALK